MIDYTFKDLPKYRAALTRAKNSGNPRNVIAVCDAAFAQFDETGWPDCWHRWDIAREDAIYALRRREGLA